MPKSFFIVLIGISGSGKGFLQKAALKEISLLKKIVSATTRPKRKYEVNGIDKVFLSSDEFKKKEQNGDLCLISDVYSYSYAYFLSDINSGNIYISEIHYKDYDRLKEITNRCVSIYVRPCNISMAIKGVWERNICDENLRRTKFLEEEHIILEKLFDSKQFSYVFTNEYNLESTDLFIKLIKNILKISLT